MGYKSKDIFPLVTSVRSFIRHHMISMKFLRLRVPLEDGEDGINVTTWFLVVVQSPMWSMVLGRPVLLLTHRYKANFICRLFYFLFLFESYLALLLSIFCIFLNFSRFYFILFGICRFFFIFYLVDFILDFIRIY